MSRNSRRTRRRPRCRKEDSLRLKALRAQIKIGVDALDRGDFAEVEDADLEGYLERLTTPAAKRVR